jgi:DNA topoisomerase II
MMKKAAKKEVSDDDDDFKPTKAGASKVKKESESKPAKKPVAAVPTTTKVEIKDEASDDEYIKPVKKPAAKKGSVKVKSESEDDYVKPAAKKPASTAQQKKHVIPDSDSEIEILPSKKGKEKADSDLKRKKYAFP